MSGFKLVSKTLYTVNREQHFSIECDCLKNNRFNFKYFKDHDKQHNATIDFGIDEPEYKDKIIFVDGEGQGADMRRFIHVYDTILDATVGKYDIYIYDPHNGENNQNSRYFIHTIDGKKIAVIYNYKIHKNTNPEMITETFFTILPNYKELYTITRPKNETSNYYLYDEYIVNIIYKQGGSGHYTVEFYDNNFKLQFKLEGYNVRCFGNCKRNIKVYPGEEPHDPINKIIVFYRQQHEGSPYVYYDIVNRAVIDTGNFVGWHHGLSYECTPYNQTINRKMIVKMIDTEEAVKKMEREIAERKGIKPIEDAKDNKHVCAVCLCPIDIKNMAVLIPCGHAQFHKTCIDAYFKKLESIQPNTKPCPICKKETILAQSVFS